MRLSFLGDVYLDKPYEVDLHLDDFIFNLESPLSKAGTPAKGKINLGIEKSYIWETFKKYPVAVNLANNHILDYGEKAFFETLAYLDEQNIAYFGAGNEENNYNNPCIINFSNMNIALLGYSCKTTNAIFGNKQKYGSALLEKGKIIEDIQEAKKYANKVIVNFHWGDEHIQVPKPSDISLAKSIINSGADLIIGHHAHVIQSIEMYNDKYIFYGLGNFIFPETTLPGYFNGKNFQKYHQVKWLPMHLESLIVDIDENFGISYRSTRFDGEKVYEEKIKIPMWIPKNWGQYNLYKTYSTKKNTIQRFLKNPKFPTKKQIKIFLGIKE